MAEEQGLTNQEREFFDDSVERCLNRLPPALAQKLEELPIVVLDEPEDAMLSDLGLEPREFDQFAAELCGLHSGVPLTERSIETTELPDVIHLFRLGIWNLAFDSAEQEGIPFAEAMDREVWITLLHELGHHFGLDEDDLAELGYA